MEGDKPFLPEDITTDILKRLPVRCLLRFQCVCKLWKNLIKSPSFIEAHLHHSNNQSPFLLWPMYASVNNLFALYLLHFDMRRFRLKEVPVADGARIIGSSNGLLCFEMIDDVRSPPYLLLCNLATREIRQTPRSINKFWGDCLCGFGFCSVVNDFKVVKIRFSLFLKVKGVEVYSLGLGSWKEVGFENLQTVRLARNSGFEAVTANGVMYWLAATPDMIISFDLAMEVFTLIPNPPSRFIVIPRLTLFENRLANLSFCSATYCIVLWVMEEYRGDLPREKWNWTKKYTIGPLGRPLRPLTILRNEIVCLDPVKPGQEAEDGKHTNILYLFNPTSVEYRTVTMGKEFHGIFNFSESLVPLNSNHTEEP